MSACPRTTGSRSPQRVPTAPPASSQAVARAMRGNRKFDTKPELRLRSELHRQGLRFRKHMTLIASGRRASADIVFPRQQVAVFVDGCYWHRCPAHGTAPRTNTGYWAAKLRRNVERDAEINQALLGAGWAVLRIWEHTSTVDAAALVVHAVRGEQADDVDANFA